ncbi:hypothetical protein B0T19DRAFT_440793 [Cercophora scortea]|uniref:Uncharacterized protein n=1 Tax=Cercophora scortea TaxID=314031 RepID=A0AAE0MJL9_9PEZI|nr:hypothetical protein B0T19DRAFT_440793 [Cercophora scortea]
MKKGHDQGADKELRQAGQAIADSQASPVFEECEPHRSVSSQIHRDYASSQPEARHDGFPQTPRHQIPRPESLTPICCPHDATPSPDDDDDVFYTPRSYIRHPAHSEVTPTSGMPYSSGSGTVPYHNHPPYHTARPGRNEAHGPRTRLGSQAMPPPSQDPFTTRPSLACTAGPSSAHGFYLRRPAQSYHQPGADNGGSPSGYLGRAHASEPWPSNSPRGPPPPSLPHEGGSGSDAPVTRVLKTAKPAPRTTKPAARHIDDDELSTHQRHSRPQFRRSEGTPVALSLRTATAYEGYYLRPRIDFGAEQVRQMPPSGWGPALRRNSGENLKSTKKSEKEKKRKGGEKGKKDS